MRTPPSWRPCAAASSSSTTRRPAGCPSDVLEPLEDLPRLEDLPEPGAERARELLDQLAVIKLNGGLGTSMGLSGPKSLLTIKPDTSFLDVIATQVLALRERHGARLPLLLMNSFATREPSLEALRRYDGLREQELPLDFLQGREPKLRADDLMPVQWPANPELEWCPPGHGDLYTALAASGHPRRAARRRPALGVRVQLGQPRGARRRAAGGLDRRAAGAVHHGGGARHRRPTARAATSRAATGRWCCARPRRCPTATPRSPTSSAGATTTPTTSGSTCSRCASCRPPTRPRRRCR